MDNFWMRVKNIYLLSIRLFVVEWVVLIVFSTLLYHLQTFLVLMGTWLRNLPFRNITLWSSFGTKSVRPRRTVWRFPCLVVQLRIWTQICGLLLGVLLVYPHVIWVIFAVCHLLHKFPKQRPSSAESCEFGLFDICRLMSGVQNISVVFFLIYFQLLLLIGWKCHGAGGTRYMSLLLKWRLKLLDKYILCEILIIIYWVLVVWLPVHWIILPKKCNGGDVRVNGGGRKKGRQLG